MIDIALAMLIAAGSTRHVTPAEAASPSQRAMQVNRESKAKLGVGIRELALLMEVVDSGSSPTLFCKDSPARERESALVADLQALVKHGYATMDVTTLKSQDRYPSNQWYAVKLTWQGNALATAFRIAE